MKILSFPDAAYIVTNANQILYNASSAATLTLTGSLPSVAFRCSVRLYAATGKTDCAGRVTVGAENLDFLAAGKKTTTTLLTALPTITTTNLNCMIEILAIDSGGSPIEIETATATKIQFENTSSGFFTPEGVWKVYSGSYALCKDAAVVNDVLRYGSDMPIKKVDVEKWFSKILYYIFYL